MGPRVLIDTVQGSRETVEARQGGLIVLTSAQHALSEPELSVLIDNLDYWQCSKLSTAQQIAPCAVKTERNISVPDPFFSINSPDRSKDADQYLLQFLIQESCPSC